VTTTPYPRRGLGRPLLPPADRCKLCGKSLYGVDRYHVKLVLKQGPLAGVTLKVLHLCRNCLEKLKANKGLADNFTLRYYKMKRLGTPA
jgi:hypothetical protein